LARKILLADDSVTAQNMGRKILTDAGYEVVTVNNGSAALKKIAESKPDLIVLDVYMPGYSGLEVCQRIKENRETARIPVLLTVGKLEPFKPEEARRARADAFVVKPFEASELLSALTKLEDKVIPQAEPYKQGRFAKAVASVDAEPDGEKFGDSDAGWKARLRIPTGKPKESEPTPDYAATQGKGFRDYVEPPTKKTAASSEVERPIPAGLPHDITPEEIAAITAAAAQLSGVSAAPSSSQVTASKLTETDTETFEVSAEENAPVTFASSPAFAAEPEVSPSRVSPESAPPVETAPSEMVAEPARAEIIATEPEIVPVEPSSLPSSIVEPVAEEPAGQVAANIEESNAAAEVETAAAPIGDISESAAETIVPEIAQPPQQEPLTTPASPETNQEVAAAPPPAATSDDEVMAALQTLMPTESVNSPAVQADSSSNEMPASTFTAHAAGPRWIAEEVTLAAEEATLSLEKEMEAPYASFSGQGAHSDPAPQELPPSTTNGQAEPPIPPVDSEQPAAHALASAAAAGEGTPVVTAVSAPTPGENSANQRSEEGLAAQVPETPMSASGMPTFADVVQAATDMMEGDVMAASWKNIRDSIAGGAPKPALAKEEFGEVEPVNGAGSNSTSAETASAKLGASDPKAIANIVDSVLAELRPKIVEEIARKLADPNKE
jgi:CheY-like chemotaxis protein